MNSFDGEAEKCWHGSTGSVWQKRRAELGRALRGAPEGCSNAQSFQPGSDDSSAKVIAPSAETASDVKTKSAMAELSGGEAPVQQSPESQSAARCRFANATRASGSFTGFFSCYQQLK